MKIFISYRRAEDNKSYIVGTIHERIAKVFGKDNVFRDTYDITGGADWRQVLGHELNSCEVILVVIGPDWTTLEYPHGQKRLFDPDDITRWEVETSLRRSLNEKITVIPVLVAGAQMPKAEELPESLHRLLDKNGFQLRNFPDFDVDMEKLLNDIRKSLGSGEDDLTIEYFEPETIYIAEGPFLMGSPLGEGIPRYETPQHEVFLPAYRIGKYPVTNTQFEEFIRQTRTPISPIIWNGPRTPEGFEEYPVTGVTWFEAQGYSQWLSNMSGRKYLLPNEAQWEKACRGGKNCSYPWGNEFDATRCNYGKPSVASVKLYPEQNEFGCFDMVGNVLQWTSTLWGKQRITPDPKYIYPWKNDGRDDPKASREIRRVVRGSTMNQNIESHRCSTRGAEAPDQRGISGARHSFRVALTV